MPTQEDLTSGGVGRVILTAHAQHTVRGCSVRTLVPLTAAGDK